MLLYILFIGTLLSINFIVLCNFIFSSLKFKIRPCDILRYFMGQTGMYYGYREILEFTLSTCLILIRPAVPYSCQRTRWHSC